MDEDLGARLKRHMPRSNDLTLIVLKGHLLLEESIDALVDAFMQRPAALRPARLSVSARLCLVRALIPGFEDRIKAAEGLNNLRNKLAHHLEHPDVERLTRDFLSRFEKPEHIDPDDPPDFDKIPISRRMKRYITFLCSLFQGAAIGVKVTMDYTQKNPVVST